MAKIVNTKYGDRRLVHLPPVNMAGGAKTANVDTIAPRDSVSQAYNVRLAEAKAQYVHKQYAYRASAMEDRKYETKNAWVGAPRPEQRPEGNLVTDQPALGNQIFQQLYQEASAGTMQNYAQGQYPVIPPVSGAPHYMQYTNQGLSTMAQPAQPQMAPGYQQAAPGYQQPGAPMQYQSYNPVQQQPQPQPPPPPPHSVPDNCPQCQPKSNERHIYYGPNGEVLPGPPPGFNSHGAVNFTDFPDDFAVEGVLQYGRLVHLTLIEAARSFPKLPDFLVRDLIEKYGHIERTIVRIVYKGGQAYVHASPEFIGGGIGRLEPEYVPVYLEEGEEFDYDRFLREYREGRYQGGNYRDMGGRPRRFRSPPPVPRSFPRDDRGRENDRDRHRYTADIRPETMDPISHLRWRKENNHRGDRIDTAPVFPVGPPTRGSFR